MLHLIWEYAVFFALIDKYFFKMYTFNIWSYKRNMKQKNVDDKEQKKSKNTKSDKSTPKKKGNSIDKMVVDESDKMEYVCWMLFLIFINVCFAIAAFAEGMYVVGVILAVHFVALVLKHAILTLICSVIDVLLILILSTYAFIHNFI